MKRIIFTIIAGTVTLFLWGGLSHTFLIDGIGFTPLPEEDKIVESLRQSVSEKGLYFFPRRDFKEQNPELNAQWEQRFRTEPVGMLIYRPVGGAPFSLSNLLTQLGFNLIVVAIVTWLVLLMKGTYWRIVFAVTCFGILGCASVSIIYWNWYAFPTDFFLAQCFDVITGFFLMGLVAAKKLPVDTPTK